MICFNEEEYVQICSRLNAEPYIRDVTIKYESPGYFNNVKRAVNTDRRGEVVFCVIRPNRKIITVTCREYPEGIYRIPTGGIGYDEDIIEAVYRECKEELGLETRIEEFFGVLKIRFICGNESIMFYSYLFLLNETGGRLLQDASDDELSGVKEVDVEGLEAVVKALGEIRGKWADWGKFRHVTSDAVLERLRAGL